MLSGFVESYSSQETMSRAAVLVRKVTIKAIMSAWWCDILKLHTTGVSDRHYSKSERKREFEVGLGTCDVR
jgi:hypothetical protein